MQRELKLSFWDVLLTELAGVVDDKVFPDLAPICVWATWMLASKYIDLISSFNV